MAQLGKTQKDQLKALKGEKFLKTHPSEDLATALKVLEIAEGSLDEVAEHYG